MMMMIMMIMLMMIMMIMLMMIMLMMIMVIVRTVTYFTSRASAIIPAARGAEAEVPVCLMVHVFLRFVVACETQQNDFQALNLVAFRFYED
jgi:hypothetical protein